VPHVIAPDDEPLVTVAREMGICLGDACDVPIDEGQPSLTR
jgi:hypothetical protein